MTSLGSGVVLGALEASRERHPVYPWAQCPPPGNRAAVSKVPKSVEGRKRGFYEVGEGW